ncbi:MAG: hypothetical protein R3263_10625, partial [Myxococcota bacterium]|nr:hypothetical protein [Myxococcota bacterium]
GHEGEEELLEAARPERVQAAENVAAAITRAEPPAPQTEARILEKVRVRQREVGYDGDLRAWLARVTPPDLE